jgi:signal transduction histidine kinase
VRYPFRTLRGRLLGGVGLGVTSFLAVLVYSQVQLREIGLSLSVVDTIYLPISHESARMMGLLERDRTGGGRLGEAVAESRALLDANEDLGPDDEERAALRATRRQLEDVEASFEEWRAAEGTLAQEAARKEVREEILQLSTLVEVRIDALSQKTAAAQTRALKVSSALLGLAALGSALLLWQTSAALRPISALTSQVRSVAAGGHPPPLGPAGFEEIDTLARAFDQMVEAVADRDRHLQALSLYLRRVLDEISAAVLVVERGEVRLGNPAARAVWGLGEGDPIPANLGCLTVGRHEAIALGDRLFEVVVGPFGDSGRILVGDDVTERRRDRERLARSERLALVGQMLAQVTHEVRNPLNAISLHAELLGEEPLTEDARAILGTVATEIRRLESVTERYLDLARRRLPETASEDLVALAGSVADLERTAMERAGVEVRVEGAAACLAETDGDTVRRALLNLLRNAVEAGAHHVRVEVRLEGSYAVISVVDDGPGMDPAVAERVFDPFYSTRARGTGLGLAIARQSLEDLGGALTVETAPGAGSTFSLRIPT